MKKKTGKILLGMGMAMALMMTGCGKSFGPSTDNPVSIKIWNYYNGDQLTSFDDLVEEFNETVGAKKGIYVESSSQGGVNDLESNVIAAANGKVGADEVPNIFAAYADTAYAIDKMGLVVDISEYLTDEEKEAYVDSYLQEGRFSKEGGMKIFPIAKSTEVFLLNKTDWDIFSEETGVSLKDLETMEGVVEVAGKYYDWTDAKTPEPGDGKAFYGRDAMANYFLIGSMQLGTEIFQVKDGAMQLNFDRDVVKTLWDNYYVPYIKGYFSSVGRFRSDDVKTGNILSFVGSSSGATFFPSQVIVNDEESYPIDMIALPAPIFEGGEKYAVQQGAGMVVTKGTEEEIKASIEFLKWFTEPERNIEFSIDSGYLPVMKKANDMKIIKEYDAEMKQSMEDILTVSVDTVNNCSLYTPRAFSHGTDARQVLDTALSDLAVADRETVVQRISQGQSMEDAVSEFLSEEYFETWYEKTLQELTACEG